MNGRARALALLGAAFVLGIACGDDSLERPDRERPEGGAELGDVCVPNSVESCYTGRQGSVGIGPCAFGFHTCLDDGTGFDVCKDQVTPVMETCDTPEDDDCDGQVNEEGVGCDCEPGSFQSCYTGPPGTEGVGQCAAGLRPCLANGYSWGPCEGDVLPDIENCLVAGDENCDGEEDVGSRCE